VIENVAHTQVRLLLTAEGGDVSSQRRKFALECAAGSGNLHVARVVLESLPPVPRSTAISIAAKHDDAAMTRLLLQARDNSSVDIVEATRIACAFGHSEVLRELTDAMLAMDRSFVNSALIRSCEVCAARCVRLNCV
jgi:hypothetical protein